MCAVLTCDWTNEEVCVCSSHMSLDERRSVCVQFSHVTGRMKKCVCAVLTCHWMNEEVCVCVQFSHVTG